jgi:hypothetical protein
MWETHDPEGRLVVLGWDGWQHILQRHADIGVPRRALLEAVAHPDARHSGRDTGEEWFYARHVGPSAWLRVVVHYEGDRGLIVTAFARRSFP